MRSFEQLADAFVIAIVPFLALGVAAIFRLRKRADYDPPFRVPGYPVVPLLFIASTIALLANAIIDREQPLGDRRCARRRGRRHPGLSCHRGQGAQRYRRVILVS